MNRIPKATYTAEFREEAVKLAHEVGSSEAARRLSISIRWPPLFPTDLNMPSIPTSKTLANWQRADKAGGPGKVGSTQRPMTEIVGLQSRHELCKSITEDGQRISAHLAD